MDAGQFRDFRNTQLQFTVSLVVNAVMLPLERTIHLENDGRVEDPPPLQRPGRTREINSDCGKQGARTAGIQGAQRIGNFPIPK